MYRRNWWQYDFTERMGLTLKELLLNHSSIYLWNKPGSSIVVIIADGDYAYEQLEVEGRQIQARVLKEYRNYHALLSVLLKDQPRDTLNELSRTDRIVLRTIEQNHTWCKNTQEALDKAVQALEVQCKLLDRLYDSSGGEAIYVPDTNALLHNPNLESWAFSETSKFTVILLTTVLSELDLLKVSHRNEEIRKKAETFIRILKEYRRRGKLTTGVTIVKDKIKIQAIALEPNMKVSLPWLDPGNNDDRILAGVIEVMCDCPRSLVMAVSRDINFQNKAEFANIPFVEPPDPL